MIVSVNEKFHIIIRRRFEEDIRKHFAGEVLVVEGALVRMQGYAYVLRSCEESIH